MAKIQQVIIWTPDFFRVKPDESEAYDKDNLLWQKAAIQSWENDDIEDARDLIGEELLAEFFPDEEEE